MLHRVPVAGWLVLVVVAFAAPAVAQDSGSSTTVSRRGGEEPLAESGSSVNVVDEGEMVERSGGEIADLLESEPGVHVQTTNVGAGSPIIRGQVGPSVLIVFDGVRINNGTFRTGPNQYLNLFDPYALQRVEVLRGSGGARYGSDAIGGVLYLGTAEPRYRTGAGGHLTLRFDSADAGSTIAPAFVFGGESTAIEAGFSYADHEELRVGGGGVLPATDYTHTGWRFRISHLLDPRLELRFSYHGATVADAGRIDNLWRSNFRTYDNTHHLLIARLNYLPDGFLDMVDLALSVDIQRESVQRHNCATDSRVFPGVDGDVTVGVTSDVFGCIDGNFPATEQIRVNNDDVTMVGGILLLEGHPDTLPELAISGGLDAYHSFVGSRQLRSEGPLFTEEERAGNFADDSNYTQLGIHAEGVYDLELSDDLTLRPEVGGRLSHVRALAPEVPGLGRVEFEYTGATAMTRIALLYADTLTVYGGWTQGFRAPNLQEATVLGNTGTFFEVPNPDLGPERSNSVELGARVRTDYARFEAVGYMLLVNSFFERRPATLDGASEVDGVPIRERYNADNATYLGADFAMETAEWNGLSIAGNLSWIQGDVTDGDETFPVRRNPPTRWMAALRYDLERPDLHIEVRGRGALAQDRLNPGDEDDLRICESRFDGVLQSDLGLSCDGTPSWAVLDAVFSADFTEQATVMLILGNLLDERYRHHGSGIEAPGFNGSVVLQGRF